MQIFRESSRLTLNRYFSFQIFRFSSFFEMPEGETEASLTQEKEAKATVAALAAPPTEGTNTEVPAAPKVDAPVEHKVPFESFTGSPDAPKVETPVEEHHADASAVTQTAPDSAAAAMPEIGCKHDLDFMR